MSDPAGKLPPIPYPLSTSAETGPANKTLYPTPVPHRGARRVRVGARTPELLVPAAPAPATPASAPPARPALKKNSPARAPLENEAPPTVLSLAGSDEEELPVWPGPALTGEETETPERPAPQPDSLRQYLAEIAREAPLSLEEELELARRIERGRQAEASLKEAPHAPQALRALREQCALGRQARDELVHASLRLVVAVARRYGQRGVPLLDLIQEGNLGLIHAVERFDYRLGHRFSTYATWWIRHSVLRAVAEQSRAIRVPSYVFTALSRLKYLSFELAQVLSREPSGAELAEAMGQDWTESRVEELQRLLGEPLSLQAPLSEDASGQGTQVHGDLLTCEGVTDPLEQATEASFAAQLSLALAALPAREALILQLRHGLTDGQERTLEDIGQRLSLTRERIRQIEREALRKLRLAESARPRLRDFLS